MATMDRKNQKQSSGPLEGNSENGKSFADNIPDDVRTQLEAMTTDGVSEVDSGLDTAYTADDELRVIEHSDNAPEGGGDDTPKRSDETVESAEKIIEEKGPSPDKVLVQEYASGGKSIKEQLSYRIRHDEENPDPEGTYGELHQPDGGRAVNAFAWAHATRVEGFLAAANGENDVEVKVCAIDSRHGVEMSDFIRGLEAYDKEHGTKIAEHTKPVVLCTPDRERVIKESGIFDGYAVEYMPFDAENVQLPPDTKTVIMAGTLNRLPAHPIYHINGDKDGDPTVIKENQRTTWIEGTSTPLITVDPESGQAEAIPVARFHRKRYINPVEDPDTMSKYVPQLGDRMSMGPGAIVDNERTRHRETMQAIDKSERRSYKEIGDAQDEDTQEARAKIKAEHEKRRKESTARYEKGRANEALGEGLRRKEDDVRAFINTIPQRTPVNYSPEAEKLLRDVAGQVGDDAMVMVSGLKRDKATPEKRLPLDVLSHYDGPLANHVLELPLVHHAFDRKGRYYSQPTEPGEYGYVVVDLAEEKDAEEGSGKAWAAHNALSTVWAKPRQSTEKILGDATEKMGQYEGALKDIDKGIDVIESGLEAAIKENPSVANDYNLANGLSQLFNKYGEYDRKAHEETPPHIEQAARVALKHAEHAAQLVPSSSVSQLEIAKARYALGESEAAADALRRARDLAPHNPEIYYFGMRFAEEQNDISEYITNAKKFLHYNSNSNTKETVDNLRNLCEAMSIDYLDNAENTDIHKTILVHDTETGEKTLKGLTIAEVKRIEAADAWATALEATQELLNGDQPYATGTNQERDRIATEFIDGYEQICPYVVTEDEVTGELTFEALPRDMWLDRPPIGSTVRFVYEGSIHESDADRPPHALREMVQNAQQNAQQEKAAGKPDVYKPIPHKVAVLGTEIKGDGGEGGPAMLPAKAMEQHGQITGESGFGKTEEIKEIIRQLESMGFSWTKINASDKPGEYDDLLARLEGQDVRVVRVGVDDISLNMLDPSTAIGNTEQIRVAKTIESFKSYLDTAYGLPEPFNSMFDKVAVAVFAANGWDTSNPDYPVANMAPTTPTIDQFVAEWSRRVEADYEEKSDGGDRSDMMRGFGRNRLYPLAKRGISGDSMGGMPIGFLSKALVEGPAVDMDAIITGKTVLDFAYLPAEQRSLAVLAWTQRIRDHMEATALERGWSKGMRHGLIIDEVQVVAPNVLADPDHPESESARIAALEKLPTQIRAAGIGLITGTQQARAVASKFAENAGGFKIAFSQTNPEARQDAARSLAVRADDVEEIEAGMQALGVGEAFMAVKGGKPIKIRTTYSRKHIPTTEKVKQALRDQPPLPVVKEAVDNKAVAEAVGSAKMTALLLTAELVTMAAITGTELPPNELPEVQKWWQKTKSEHPEYARKVVMSAVGRAIDRRSEAIAKAWKEAEIGPAAAKYEDAKRATDGSGKSKYKEAKAMEYEISMVAARKPQELAKEVAETIIGRLEGEPAGSGYSNARHVPPQVAVMKLLANPHFRNPPAPDNFASPLPHRLQGGSLPLRQRVKDRLEALGSNALSPIRWTNGEGQPDEKTKALLYDALLGKDKGKVLFDGLDVYTGEKEIDRRRTEVVARMGATAARDPRVSPLVSMLGYAANLPKQQANQAVA